MDPEATATAIAVAEFDDPATLAQALRDADIHYLSLAAREYRAQVTSVDLGPVCLQDVADGAHVTYGTVEGHRTVLLFAMRDLPDGTLVNGVPMLPHQMMVLAPGAPIHCRVPGRHHWAALSIDEAALTDAGEGDGEPHRGRFTLRQLDGRAWSGLAATVVEISALARADPGRLTLSPVRKGITEACRSLAGRALRGAFPDGGRLRALHRRVGLVASAEELLAARLGTPVYSEDVGAALGVSVRTLHDAFMAVHGMSLHRYLHLRRLNQAHEALRGRRGEVRQVKEAAIAAGFWHLGRFAHAYRARFGEAPSETLAGRGAG